MLICTACKNTVEVLPQKLVYDEFDRPHLTDGSCPNCGRHTLAEATACPVCGNYYDNEELDGVCDECLKTHETIKVALMIGDANREPVEINGFIASALSADRICHILEEAVRKMIKDRDEAVIEYLRDDLPYFTEWVEKHAHEVE